MGVAVYASSPAAYGARFNAGRPASRKRVIGATYDCRTGRSFEIYEDGSRVELTDNCEPPNYSFWLGVNA